jgi:predicted methyltransferase
MYGNSLHAWGVREPGQVMQIWTGRDGDWTMIVSYATGMSCIVAMGDSWEFIQTENPV